MNVGSVIMAMSPWWYGIGMGGMALLVAVGVFRECGRVRRCQREHLETHAPLSDDHFLVTTGAPPEGAEFAIVVRKGVAKAMGIPPATLHPTDTIEYICGFSYDGMDFLEITMNIESVLGMHTPNEFWKPFFRKRKVATEPSLGDLARVAAENLGSLVSAKKPKE